jgi:hypothetical protein
MPEKAEPHLREWQNRDVLVPDPLNQELDMLLARARVSARRNS